MFHQAEGVGENFDVTRLQRAQSTGWRVLDAVAACVKPGDTVERVREHLVAQTRAAGVAKSWHPPQIRLGQNTLCAFNAKALTEHALGADDIYFLDIGLVVDGYEADCGRTFVLGHDADMQRIADDARRIHQDGVAHWNQTRCSGRGLYEWTVARAQEHGWQLSMRGADGHRLGDFPHQRFSRDSLIDCDFSVSPDRWVYEVHLHDPRGRFGAFYEDLLR